MKTAKEILKQIEDKISFTFVESVRFYVLEAIEIGINEGKKEGISESIKACAEKALANKIEKLIEELKEKNEFKQSILTENVIYVLENILNTNKA